MVNLGWREDKRIGIYGNNGPPVVVLHGGPGATGGSSAPVAKGLSDDFRVLEPWQRVSGDRHLSVAVHVADLHELIESRCSAEAPALVGESWGAMLALAYAAEHPDTSGPIVLVGCGTFDVASRARIGAVIEERTTDEMRKAIQRLDGEISASGKGMEKKMELSAHIYSYEPIDVPGEGQLSEPFDMKGHTETWNDMLRCQAEGIYPQTFTSITSSVIMLHGAYDPHPGKMTRNTLLPYIPQLEYQEFEKCGHAPEIEKHVKNEFFRVMRDWLKNCFHETQSV